ncbi:ClbS/DfsB family four-helix bundle protein [Lactococcus lactis]|uniref:ClbS/DfsB family four-helix bundle protein n=1 Tax=Lactococcus lactis TaxID=1358 RepID=UPI0024162634|nr:ClbS/DfsB family four-helix bundle protein [Lactococcus lactis]MDG4973061.1 ClbS/DfsB family four-helix bundle protein [Lactococcus lactis]
MRVYTNKEELITEIKQRSQKYIAEFEKIPEDLRNRRTDEVDKTPSENLSYQLGWLSLLLGWKEEEKAGIEVQTLAEGYKWNNLGKLYEFFYETYGQIKLIEQIQQLNDKVEELCSWIDSLSEEELFKPEIRKWATTKARWPVYKWIHINTVAPFTNFRTKIRKWKKLYYRSLL